MSELSLNLSADTSIATLCRGRVLLTRRDGSVVVALQCDELTEHVCDLLTPVGQDRVEVAPGDEVLVWHGGRSSDRAVVLGRICHSNARGTEIAVASDARQMEVPDELVIEAKHSLTLRVGSGSITIREDGKILIKGKDLVSHAKRLNRIKGGAVQIN